MVLPARLATEADAGVLAKYVEAGRPSVTKQARPYPPTQQKIGEKCRLDIAERQTFQEEVARDVVLLAHENHPHH